MTPQEKTSMDLLFKIIRHQQSLLDLLVQEHREILGRENVSARLKVIDDYLHLAEKSLDFHDRPQSMWDLYMNKSKTSKEDSDG